MAHDHHADHHPGSSGADGDAAEVVEERVVE
jgi:hypothetical protein